MTSTPPNNVKFQLELFQRQIYSTFLITVGGVFFGLGAAFWGTSQIIIRTEEYSTSLGYFVSTLNDAGINFLLLGITGLVFGIFLPLYGLNKWKKQINE